MYTLVYIGPKVSNLIKSRERERERAQARPGHTYNLQHTTLLSYLLKKVTQNQLIQDGLKTPQKMRP